MDSISFFVTPHLREANEHTKCRLYAKILKNFWNRQHTILTMIMMMITAATAAIIMIMALSAFTLQQNVTSLTFKRLQTFSNSGSFRLALYQRLFTQTFKSQCYFLYQWV